jgi:hypothetical protein
MDSEKELLNRAVDAIERKSLFRSILEDDSFDDWNLVKELGEFLVALDPETDVMGHVLLTRAHRHLGNRETALHELWECQNRLVNTQLEYWETELILPVLAEEEKLLSQTD